MKPLHRVPSDWFHFSISGQLLEEDVPPHPPSMPRSNQEGTEEPEEAELSAQSAALEGMSGRRNKVVTLLKEIFVRYQRAVVLASRGGCWVLLVNACRGLWNSLAVLRHYLNSCDICIGRGKECVCEREREKGEYNMMIFIVTLLYRYS